ncbi:heme biosynthesis HemY N-terminal domain-containing protein [Henriciella sp.]|uniref:heme biosynthesis protein HemY n=1 Tax=Henriciella sp. TaxID=1968823 RepID=UPI0026060822|nr:heme biosynthesis HemY N-terminal domain-containing protein [Henriciella sp.]
MIVLFLLIALIVLAGIAVLWASRLPGSVLITLGPETAIELKLVVAILAVLLLGAAMAMIWGAVTGLLKLPSRFTEARHESKVRKANKALADGLLSAEAGDVRSAKRYASKASQHADDERMKLLLEARTAEISDDWSGAERAWGLLARLPGGQLAGLRGAATAASERGDVAGAEARAREALEMRTEADWPFNALFDSQIARGHWQDALQTLAIGEKRGAIKGDSLRRRRAVLYTALACALPNAERRDAQRMLADAIRSASTFPPAAYHGARHLMMDGKVKAAQGVLELGWKAHPHPALAHLCRRLDPADTPKSQIGRLESLIATNPDARESKILKAEIAMASRDWMSAIRVLALLVEEKPTARLCLLLEQALRGYGDAKEADRWGRMAVTASREAEWSDIDPNGNAFDYSRRDWGRLVYAFGDAGNLVHPRYEAYGRELEAGRHIALPAPVRRVRPASEAPTPRQPMPGERPLKLSEPPVDYVQDADEER